MKADMVKYALGGALLAGAGLTAAAQDVADTERPQAGEYRSTVTFQGLDLPGAPPQVAEMMGRLMSTTTTYCLTEAEIDEGFQAITDRSMKGAEDCSYDRYGFAGGQLDAEMVCRVDGRQMRMNMTGTADRTTSDITMKMSGDFGVGDGTMTLRAQAERIGACS
ncbi:DUF3617 domain-containing protein [Erythrobacter sp.]|jgi:hypothetical protein|uniref:DUF3617 domain-containing protein n=1 Tax=Erythrobacter sp. TaxID=1042 RepID=UPI002EB3AA1F|nr:DUF3617 domain-containing protein [Erythrobacter sp.]